MTPAELVAARRADIIAIAAKYGAGNIRLFGSVARGDADENSDIDLLVDLAPDRTLFDLGGMADELRVCLQRNIDVVTTRGLRERLRDRILSEARPL